MLCFQHLDKALYTATSDGLCVSQVATGRPDATPGLLHRLDYKYPFTALFLKAVSHLLTLTVVNALVCGVLLGVRVE